MDVQIIWKFPYNLDIHHIYLYVLADIFHMGPGPGPGPYAGGAGGAAPRWLLYIFFPSTVYPQDPNFEAKIR